MSSPLQGRRVIELGTMIAAPFAAHLLAELGAEVIKIEPPSGDPTRMLVRGGPSGSFLAYSHGKKSVCMDLGNPDARAAFDQLLATADIVVHNLAPKAARRLKVTYEDCVVVRPDIVYAHIRGYGPGPQADDLASNPVAEASSGVMEGNRVNGRPSRLGPSHHDQFAGSYAVIGILAALLQPQPSERTHKIEVGLYETGLHVAARDLAGVQLKTHLLGRPEREPNGEFAMPGYGAYETADMRWIYLLILNDTHWLKFCQAMQLLEANDQSLYRLRDRKHQRERVEKIVRHAVASMPYDEIAERLNAAGVGNTEVLPLERVLDAPQARHPGKLEQLRFRDLPFEIPAFPPAQPVIGTTSPPQELGQDTLEILRSVGVSAEECERLLQTGVIAVTDAQAFPWAPIRTVG